MAMLTRYAPESCPRNAQFPCNFRAVVKGFVERLRRLFAHYAAIGGLGDRHLSTRLTLGNQI
jgi:hypothetical protein